MIVENYTMLTLNSQVFSEVLFGVGGKENRFSQLPDLSFGIVGKCGVGKSIRFRQLFLERTELIRSISYESLKIPIFIQAREFERVVQNYLAQRENLGYNLVEFGPYDGYQKREIIPADFGEFPHHIVIEILVDSVMNSTTNLTKYFDKNFLVELLGDRKFTPEIFIDGCDEVGPTCQSWIEMLCHGKFFDSNDNIRDNQELVDEVIAGNEFLDTIDHYEDDERSIEEDEKSEIA